MHEMVEYIHRYYQNEQINAFLSIVIGTVILLSSFILSPFFENEGLVKGLSYAFKVGGLFFLIAGVIVAVGNRGQMTEIRNSAQTNVELHKSEIARMSLVMKSSYRSALILFSTLIFGGLVLALSVSSDFWKGIGLGLLIVGTTGHAIEAFSMWKSKRYQQELNSIKL